MVLGPDILAVAVRFHRFGAFAQAERLYRHILREQPDNAEAWCRLGDVCHALGRRDEAVENYRHGLTLRPEDVRAHNNLGVVLMEQDRLDEAIASYREALRLQSDSADAHNNLGLALMEQDRLDEAAVNYREALRLKPNYAGAHNNRGRLLAKQSRFQEAAACFGRAVQLQPDFVDAWVNLGDALRGLGRRDEAGASYERAANLRPSDPGSLAKLGAMLMELGRAAEAVACYDRALRLRPDAAGLYNNLGLALLHKGRLDSGQLQQGTAEEAALSFQQALYLQPDLAEAHVNLGLALEDQGRAEEAVFCFEQALHLRPDLAETHVRLGLALAARGKMDEALAAIREAYRLDPDHALTIATLSQLAALGRHRFRDDEVRHFRELAAREHLPLFDRAQLYFALTWLLDRAGDYAAAFECCRRAKELHQEFDCRRGVTFGPAEQDRFVDQFRTAVDRRIAAFTVDHFARTASFALDTELPIFVVGMPRSGTTLAEQVLASHPRVHGAGEVLDMGRLVGALAERLGGGDAYPEQLARLDAAAAREAAEGYLRALRQRGGGTERVVDKMPSNFLELGLIATLFPKAHVVQCRREPADTCLSCYFQNSVGCIPPFTLDLRHLGQLYREYDRLMAHWARVLPVPVFELCYEEMTADQEGTSRRLLAFCGLDWHERCLRFHDTPRVVPGGSILQVRQPMYRRSVGRWKRYEAQLQPLLEALRDGPI